MVATLTAGPIFGVPRAGACKHFCVHRGDFRRFHLPVLIFFELAVEQIDDAHGHQMKVTAPATSSAADEMDRAQ